MPGIAETLANLQLPPELHQPSLQNPALVPLPRRPQANSAQHQIALCIREGRKAAQLLSAQPESSSSSKDTLSPTTLTSMSVAMEQDFTVEGKKGELACPFSAKREEVVDGNGVQLLDGAHGDAGDLPPHQSADPICAAMFEETTSQTAAPASSPAAKCPIRFLDQHSPEEIAHYVETHKHEIPRSHEVCVRRYQKNEEQIRKLDAKYGNLASMIQDLSHLHQPMLPADARRRDDVDRASNERVEDWAHAVSATGVTDPDRTARDEVGDHEDMDRESHFDRPLKEVRVGESPSRPWGISVPVFDMASLHGEEPQRPPVSPPPAPVRMPSPVDTPVATPAKASKCPFDHAKFAMLGGAMPSPVPKSAEEKTPLREPTVVPDSSRHYAPVKEGPIAMPLPLQLPPQPTFINQPEALGSGKNSSSQMVFTGPVFIGYPMEQAIQFMQHFQQQQQQQQQ